MVYYFINFHLVRSFFSFSIRSQNKQSNEPSFLKNLQINFLLNHLSQRNNYMMADQRPFLNNHFQIVFIISNAIQILNLTSRYQLDQVLKYEVLEHPFCLAQILKFNFLEAVFKANSYYFETLRLAYYLINFAKKFSKIGSKSQLCSIKSQTYVVLSKIHQVSFSCQR